jgi:hypothetical protein
MMTNVFCLIQGFDLGLVVFVEKNHNDPEPSIDIDQLDPQVIPENVKSG